MKDNNKKKKRERKKKAEYYYLIVSLFPNSPPRLKVKNGLILPLP